jgi:pyrimidine-nucleoside phosphorylase
MEVLFDRTGIPCYNSLMRAVDLIGKKREGGTHTVEEVQSLVQGYVQGVIPDYQMSAWLMAVLWRGLTENETFALTGAMVASGDVLNLSDLPGIPVDKHSTGGVGDKTTLAVVPILASAGVPVAKMSGRGLGHTGGTLDKLESIPGLRTQLSTEQILSQVASVGACVCAQTERLVPADRKMYALRDATATVESLPLIAASIMSKKIAGGSRAVVLDVKVGGGAFMKTLEDARALAEMMIKIGAAYGQRVVAVLSDMNVPLGRSIGNRLEVDEVAGLLQNSTETERHLKQIVRLLSAVGFVVAGRVASLAEGEALADRQIESGAAFQKLSEIVAAQGGDTEYLRRPDKPPVAPVAWPIRSELGGFVSGIDAQGIGLAAMRLGAGRATKDDTIDPTAGIVFQTAYGHAVALGETLATLYTAREETAQEVAAQVRQAITIKDQPPQATPLIYETLGL